MRFFLLLVLTVLATGCSENGSDTDYRSDFNSRLVYEISSKVSQRLKKEKNLHLIECGGGKDKITLLHWGFFYYKDINIEEARELLILIGNRFLEAFNADERIRPYLATYPFKPENIQVEVFLKKPNGSELEPEKLHVVAMTEGGLNYMIRSSETLRLKKVYKETYDEAASKLNTGASPDFDELR